MIDDLISVLVFTVLSIRMFTKVAAAAAVLTEM